MPVQSQLSRVLQTAEYILTLLEKLSDQAFYESFLGERFVNLLKRYFGNDVVILSFVFYISGIVKTKASELFARLWRLKMEKPNVCVQIRSLDYELYNAIEFVVRKRQTKVRNPNINRVFAAYDHDPMNTALFGDEEEEEEEDENHDDKDKKVIATPNNARVVQFYPPDDTTNELVYKGRRIKVMHHEGKTEEDDDGDVDIIGAYWEVTIEGDSMDDLKKVIQEWANIYNNRGNNQPKSQFIPAVYKTNGISWTHSRTIKPRTIDSIALKQELKDKLLCDMAMFKSREQWYTSRGIPHRRGYLLHGPPGTGKTSLIQAIAGHLKMHMGIINIADMPSDNSFADMLQKVPLNTLIILEDFDRCMVTLEKSGTLSMAGILNALDGIQGQNGSMIFMTCNHIEDIDPAILRPGRMDVKLLLDYADRTQIEQMFWRFFGLDYETMTPVTGKRKAYLQDIQKRFADSIPEGQVTTAELENLFITVILASDAGNLDEEALFNSIFDEIPSFLEKVRLTREGVGITSFSDSKTKGDSENVGDASTKDDTSEKEEDDATKSDNDSVKEETDSTNDGTKEDDDSSVTESSADEEVSVPGTPASTENETKESAGVNDKQNEL